MDDLNRAQPTEVPADAPLTPPRQSRKRAVDLHIRPPEINRLVKRIKDELKAAYVKKGLTQLRSDRCELDVPLAVVDLIPRDAHYQRATELIDDGCLSTLSPSDNDRVDDFVAGIGPRFLEALLVNDDAWIWVTHFDAFLQEMPEFDGCAHKRRDAYNALAVASVAVNAYAGATSWRELRIQWGNIQLLCLGGLYGQTDSTNRFAFLGASFPLSEERAFDTYLLKKPATGLQIQRILRDYSRMRSTHQLGFRSKRFVDQGFALGHPLRLPATSQVSLAAVASFTLSSWVSGKTTMDHVQHCLRLLGSTAELRALWESVPSGSIRTMEGLNTIIKSNNFVTTKFAKSIIKNLTMMESVNMVLATVSTKGINLHELVNLGLDTAIRSKMPQPSPNSCVVWNLVTPNFCKNIFLNN